MSESCVRAIPCHRARASIQALIGSVPQVAVVRSGGEPDDGVIDAEVVQDKPKA